jgi:hypothetical protein
MILSRVSNQTRALDWQLDILQAYIITRNYKYLYNFRWFTLFITAVNAKSFQFAKFSLLVTW